MTLDEALESAIDGDAGLCLGAGFSLGAMSMSGKSLPSAKALAKILCESIDYPQLESLEAASEVVLDEKGADFLISLLVDHYRVRAGTNWQQVISEAHWRRIYTTNYDNIVERCANVTPVTLEDDIYNVSKKQTLCVHLNGYIERLTRSNISTHLKLTESSYASASISESPWCALFREDVRLAQAVFFIGYSLSDLDLKRVLLENSSLIDKCFFIVGSEPQDVLKRRVSKFGQLVPETAEQFALRLEQKRAVYTQKDKPQVLQSLERYTIKDTSVQLTDTSFRNLITDGRWRPEDIQESLRSESAYFLPRRDQETIFRILDQEKTAVVTSSIGNGKSLLLEGLKYDALTRGYTVYQALEQTPETALELEQIGKSNEKTIIVVDNYEGWLSALKHFAATSSDRAKLVLSARSSIHDVLSDSLCDALGTEYVSEINVDLLDAIEIDKIVGMFDLYGLWGVHANKAFAKKHEFIRERSGSQLSSILLGLIKSPDIEQRYKSLLSEASKDSDVLDLILMVLILTVIQGSVQVSTLANLIDLRVLNSSSVRRSVVVSEVLDFRQGTVLLRSPTTAQHILKHLADPNRVASCLILIARRSHETAGASWQNNALWKKITRFGSLDLVLPEEAIATTVIRFYESIKNLRLAYDNPLFWLQYAVACLTTGQTQRAKTYFETAYSYAEKTGFDTFQIDNHYARFLLVEAQEDASVGEAFAAFREARSIINRQLQMEERHYPFRVAIEYQNLLDRFGAVLSDSQLGELEVAARTVLEYSETLSERLLRHWSVRKCKAAMRYVVSRTKEIQENH